MTHYLVLGAGLQGTAAVHDLIVRGNAKALTWVDNDAKRLETGLARIRKLCAAQIGRPAWEGLHGHVLDASNEAALAPLFKAADVCMNALPYRFALQMTRLALDGECHYLDLGGNTELVRKQMDMHRAHPNGAKLCVLPDCGLMPGMGNVFTALAVKRLGNLEKVSVRCGGLPQNPKPPLDYMLVFSVAGLTNEYFGNADVLRDGKLATVPTFTELEPIEWPGMGRLEAFITSGGLSTVPWTFEGKIKQLDYKTIRYPGHYEKFKVLLDLGLLSETPVRVGANDVVPRHLLHVMLEKVLSHPGDKDLVLLSMHAVAANGAKLDMHVEDRLDDVTGFTAMERTTAYSAAACAHLVASGKVAPGPRPLEVAVDPEQFLQSLLDRGISVKVQQSP